MRALIDSLRELGKKTERDFGHHIDLLSERITEREEERSALEKEEQAEILRMPGVRSTAALVTDEDVRQMFRTLRHD